MMSRRELLSLGTPAMGVMLPLRSSLAAGKAYDEAIRSTWAPLQIDRSMRELIRYATLAANSHNTQPWKFGAEQRRITIAADPARRCPVVDPSDHHLFVSLGCAAENLAQAAAATGLMAATSFESDTITIELDRATPVETDLFRAIPHRQSTRATYDGAAASNEALASLEKAGTSAGVSVTIITDKSKISAIGDYVLDGNSAQLRDKAFVDELIHWIRFNEADAVATMDGLFTAASGNSQWPAWLARLLLPLVMTEKAENEKYRAQIQSSAGIAIFVADRPDKAHWVEVGRACQRFALQATALGLKQAFINQPVEVPQVRRQFASFLGLGDRQPDLVMRFGFGPSLPKSLRRPVEQLMV